MSKAGNIAVGGNIVVVVGGGNTAMDAARLAKRSGAENVTLVYRRTRKYMPADEHELALALADGVTFAELAAPVKQADGVLKCEKMVLGEADASGRRSPVGSGEFFTVPCDLVISAVGEQVDDALMAANGIELDKKGRPAFRPTWMASTPPATPSAAPPLLSKGIADAAAFAEAVIGETLIPMTSPSRPMSLRRTPRPRREYSEDERVHLLRGRPLPAVRHRLRKLRGLLPQPRQCGHPHGRRQPPDRPRGQDVQRVRQLHQFCPYSSEALPRQVHPVPDRRGHGGQPQSRCPVLGGDKVRVRTFGEPKDYDLSGQNDLPPIWRS